MKYCRWCVLPDTRPHLMLDDQGVCNACRFHAAKQEVDWKERECEFLNIVRWARSVSRGYDCVIPVSGGKDSTYQVVKCLEVGLNPLCVTWKPPVRTRLGEENLVNLVRLGVDHLDYQINPIVERKFMREAFVRFGSPAIPMHLAIFNIPLNIAVRFNIPLIVWGENSALEYGGEKEDAAKRCLDADWVRKYGVTGATEAKDWVSSTLSEKELTPYFGPPREDLKTKDIRGIFLGFYLGWDPLRNLEVARTHGFKSSEGSPRTGTYDFADLDDPFISVHHFMKWYKFGFTRSFDTLSLEIRNQRLSRPQAVEILRCRGDETPGEDIAQFCEFVDLPEAQYGEVIERFRNSSIWSRRRGYWEIDGFLISDWRWECA